jgi:hypothetical protein
MSDHKLIQKLIEIWGYLEYEAHEKAEELHQLIQVIKLKLKERIHNEDL